MLSRFLNLNAAFVAWISRSYVTDAWFRRMYWNDVFYTIPSLGASDSATPRERSRFQAESDPYALIHAAFLLFDIKTIDKSKPQHIGDIRFDLCNMLGFHLTFVIVYTLNEKKTWRYGDHIIQIHACEQGKTWLFGYRACMPTNKTTLILLLCSTFISASVRPVNTIKLLPSWKFQHYKSIYACTQ